MTNRSLALAAIAVLMTVLVGASSTHAGATFTHVNRLTFNRSMALPGVVLLPGTYMFESGSVPTSPDIVRVTSSDYQKLYYTGFTQPTARSTATPRTDILVLGEAPAGTPVPIRVWYPIGSASGHEFLYR
jgi:hypothetical protein